MKPQAFFLTYHFNKLFCLVELGFIKIIEARTTLQKLSAPEMLQLHMRTFLQIYLNAASKPKSERVATQKMLIERKVALMETTYLYGRAKSTPFSDKTIRYAFKLLSACSRLSHQRFVDTLSLHLWRQQWQIQTALQEYYQKLILN